MATTFKNQMRQVMLDAWRIYRTTAENFAECLKRAWQLLKLKARMHKGVVQFFYTKLDGTTRQAFGKLTDDVLTEVKGTGRKPNDSLFTYYDCDKMQFRSFKKYNFLRMV